MRLRRCKFDGLDVGVEARREIARDDLQRYCNRGYEHAYSERCVRVTFPRIAQHLPRRHGGDGEADEDVGGQRRVKRFGQEGRTEEGAAQIDGDQLAGDDGVPRGRIHPRVDRDHENRRRCSGHGDRDPAQPMHARRKLIPAVQINADEDRFDEKRKAFGGKGNADDRAGLLHELRPE